MQLYGYCLHKKMEIIEEYHTAFISLSNKELQDFNFKNGDTEGFVNLPLSIKNIKFSAIFI
jgi:phosphoesterase RecJ-like protein